MKIAYDHQMFTNQSYGGISRYYKDLAGTLLKQGQNVNIFAGMHRNYYVPLLPKGIVRGIKLNNYPFKSRLAFSRLNHVIGQLQMKQWKPDIIHETYYSSLASSKTNAVRFATVHDMIHELYPDMFSSRDNTTQFKQDTISRVDHIISISESTKMDMMKIFDIEESKISVIHHGVDSSLFEDIPGNLKISEKPYLLYVGTRGGYKNFNGFLKAVASSSLLMKNFDLIAVGDEFTLTENKFISSLGFNDNQVRQVPHLTDFHLAQFYSNASAFVFPSLYEGFGLPPLEAMSAGCPVISSNTSSMPEVVRNAAIYFNPYDTEEMCNAIEKVVFSEDLKKQLILLGYENIKSFSLNKCASKTREVYSKLTGKT